MVENQFSLGEVKRCHSDCSPRLSGGNTKQTGTKHEFAVCLEQGVLYEKC